MTDVLKEEFEVVGVTGDGASAVAMAIDLQPDLVVSDLSMPVMSGLEVAARLRAANHPARIVIVTAHPGDDLVRLAHANGVLGVVLKDRLNRDLTRALRLALEDRQFVSSASVDA
jgi:DNA-binding NarL/FixJ family response regulator